MFVRLVTLQFSTTDVVLRDFCPKYDERSPHNEGWQPFQDLFSLAAAWINKNSHVNFRLINLQSLVVKAKKDINNGGLLSLSYALY